MKKIILLGLVFIFGIGQLMGKNHLDNSAPANAIEQVLDFWFDYSHHHQVLYNRAQWWQKGKVFDEMIRQKFAELRQQALEGKLNTWLATPRGALAYIILIDQFSRNLFRETPLMYQYDNLALAAAHQAINNQFDKALSLTERVFLYMPFEHSEQISDQKKSVQLFEALLMETPTEVKPIAESYLWHAKEHYSAIEKFHRFPYRNKILGRNSTSEEIEFLKVYEKI